MSKEYREYFGKIFYKDKKGYWICTQAKIPWAHRWVWINYNGPIPYGNDIHHKDEDKSNNEIDNLQPLSRSEHLKEHWKDPELREKRRKFLTDIRSKAHEWLRSDEGRKKQSQDAIKGWKKRKKFIRRCIECHEEKETYVASMKYCSDKCRMRRKRRREDLS